MWEEFIKVMLNAGAIAAIAGVVYGAIKFLYFYKNRKGFSS